MVAQPLSLRLFICKSFIYLQPENKQTNKHNPLTKNPPNNAVIISSLPMREVEREGERKREGEREGEGKGEEREEGKEREEEREPLAWSRSPAVSDGGRL